MKLLCIKNNTKLVKGCVYDILYIKNLDPKNGSTYNPTIKTNVGTFSPKCFTSLDGSEVPEIEWFSPEYNSSKNEDDLRIRDVRKLEKGSIIVCKYNSSKLLEEGKMYRVTDTLYVAKKSTSPFGYIEQKLKIEGYNRWLNIYRFRECTAQEKRNISLSGIFDEGFKPVDLSDIINSRKIDRVEEVEKNRILLSTLLYGILDKSRNNLSTIEWAAQKKGKDYDITEADFDPLLNKKMIDIIKMFE